MEKKDIRQYLHYYLGCDCLCEKSNYHLVHNLSINNGEQFKLTVRVLASLEGQSTAIIKPILRRVRDIKDSEKTELIYSEAQGGNQAYSSMAESIHYLLSKHFDLFNLIESGLAIDKETLNP